MEACPLEPTFLKLRRAKEDEYMGNFGGFYKGDKKKQKQNKNKASVGNVSNAPVFVMPKMLEKKKKTA